MWGPGREIGCPSSSLSVKPQPLGGPHGRQPGVPGRLQIAVLLEYAYPIFAILSRTLGHLRPAALRGAVSSTTRQIARHQTLDRAPWLPAEAT